MSAPEPFALGAPRAEAASFPLLDRVAARTARELGQMLARIGLAAQVRVGESSTIRFDEWKATLPPFVALARYRAGGLRGGIALSFPTALVTALVDLSYGGDGTGLSPRAAFGAAEHRLFERVATDVARVLATAWADVHPVAPELAACVTALTDLTFGRAGDRVVVQRFVIAGWEPLELLYPVAALRALPLIDRAEDGEAGQVDPVWRARLSAAVLQARLPVRTVVARPTLPLERLLSLAPGDVIDVCLPAQVPLTVAGRLLAHGTIGEANGRAAIKLSTLEHGGFLE